MRDRPHGAPTLRPPTIADIRASLAAGLKDFTQTPLAGAFFAGFYVLAGLLMSWITYLTGHTFWLVLAALGFPMIGAFAALGFYEISRRRMENLPCELNEVARIAWAEKSGQIPWFAGAIIVIFLFWFFLGHMIFALFLGLSPMTNVTSSLGVFLSPNGLMMIAFGTCVGAAFSALIFSMSVMGIPMLLDRDVDFMTAAITSVGAVMRTPATYFGWGLFIGMITLIAMVPFFLGLFLVLPIFGHATWHLYKRLSRTQA